MAVCSAVPEGDYILNGLSVDFKEEIYEEGNEGTCVGSGAYYGIRPACGM